MGGGHQEVKIHLLRAKDRDKTACGRALGFRATVATRDLDRVDCDVCYRSYEAARIFLGHFNQFEGSDQPPSKIVVGRDGTVAELA
jgi:hypothetical protein